LLKMLNSMNERRLKSEASERLAGILREVPFLSQARLREESGPRDSGVNLVASVRSNGVDRRLLCQIKTSGQPRIARQACLELVDYASSDKKAYPVFIAPYISPAAAAICNQYNVGYLDFAGNCRLAFDKIYIRCEGFPNPAIERRDLRSLYSPKAERVLRVLLTAGKRTWRTQELADEARVSLGQVANVKKLLADREWIGAQPTGFGLRTLETAVLPLLQEWTANYRSSRNSAREFYSLKSIPEIEASLSEAGRKPASRIAFTGFSGAARLAPAVRYSRVTAYAGRDLDANRLALKPVSSGANVTLLKPYDEGIYYGTQEVEGAPIVSPVQIYLDLTQTKGRGEEAASAILEEAIKPLWR
jgi:hypothetical protein